MPQPPETRALQHLLVQGFTLYTDEAAAALRDIGKPLEERPQLAYAIVIGRSVQCCWGGQQLLVPLEVEHVRDARLKLETAVTLGLAPPRQPLDAYPDELIEREAKRRKLAQQDE